MDRLTTRILPILFNTDMVRAILDDRKTATRRCVKFLPGENPNWTGYIRDGLVLYNGRNEPCCRKPPYEKGNILYVRETWCNANKAGFEPDYYYFADTYICEDYDRTEWKWRPSIHMPKEAARIWLKVTDVRVERLQNMKLNDFLNEGVVIRPEAFNDPENAYLQAKRAFIQLWDSTIPKRQQYLYSWAANPWVWVIEFERCEKPAPCILKGMEPVSNKKPCIGYQKSKDDDEPCEMCKGCPVCDGEELELPA